MTEPRHVDDFIDDPKSDPYASAWFESFRRPAYEKIKYLDSRKLFATYQGVRYRVTGCSRMGDVWLHANPNEESTYQHRVDVDECSDWGAERGNPFVPIARKLEQDRRDAAGLASANEKRARKAGKRIVDEAKAERGRRTAKASPTGKATQK